ncbi:MAG: hypothetical protein KC983_06975, partial [Phycisphaerales bacterium]|nr:hypothetical protein [Phycisphaerales bacterium]
MRYASSGLILILAMLVTSTASAQSIELQATSWATKINVNGEKGMNALRPVLTDFVALDPDLTNRLLPRMWVELSPKMKLQVMRGLAFPENLPTSDLPHRSLRNAILLAMKTNVPAARHYALLYLNYYTLRNDLEVTDELIAWLEKSMDTPFREVCLQSIDAFVVEMRDDSAANIEAMTPRLDHATKYAFEYVPAFRNRAISAGIVDDLERWLASDVPVPTKIAICEASRTLQLDSSFFRDNILPMTERGEVMPVRLAALKAMAARRHDWAIDHMLGLLSNVVDSDEEFIPPYLARLSMAIASYKNPKAIPLLIGVLKADNSPLTTTTIGQYGLCALTQTAWDPETQDAAYWVTWWE